MTDHRVSSHNMADSVQRVIRSGHGRRFMTRWLLLLLLPLLALLLWLLWPADEVTVWQTHTVDRGDMVMTATATGNLQPSREISVGAEISGVVREVLVAENDQVRQGDVLARFDTQELTVSLRQAQARLALVRASLQEAQVTYQELEHDEQRIRQLVQQKLASDAELDAAVAARQRAGARIAYARAAVEEAAAAVQQSQTRLDKAVIVSPMTGVVLQRNVEPGTTVAASFQTPQLFLLAEDLRRMELHVALDEADVAQVQPGQPARFTVDAWPDRQFEATVLKVYLYPQVENNVVTYTTVLGVDNSDGLLRPGMTATATITTGSRENVLRVPNQALRFTPPQPGKSGGLFSHPASLDREQQGSSNIVWRLEDGEPRRIVLRTGFTDGRYTEVIGNELAQGQQLVIGSHQGKAGEKH